MSRKPIVAVVGRPNVGKSTLVNRLIGSRKAIVEERPGVTRDRNDFEVDWAGVDFTLVDTGGWLPHTGEASALDNKVSEQSEHAIDGADLVLFVVDARVGIATEDALIAEKLRTHSSPSFVVANKVDDPAHEAAIWEFMSLGLGEPKPVSALHGRGTADLLDAVVSNFPLAEPQITEEDDWEDDEESSSMIAVAIVGRPNVGKSTLFNTLNDR